MGAVFETSLGRIVHGDCLQFLGEQPPDSVDLIMTSPPFGLIRKKKYGNADSKDYVSWFKPFGSAFKRALKDKPDRDRQHGKQFGIS